LDSSALVKRYVVEGGSDEVRLAMGAADSWSSCRLAFVETVRAVGFKAGDAGVRRVRRDWNAFRVIELDQVLAEHSATLAGEHGLKALDAIHLAAALEVRGEDLRVATWDVRLHRAAREHGLQTLPAALG
jgi:uncharacterized protein